MVVADIAAQDRVGKAREDAPEAAAMRRLLVRNEQIFQWRRAAGEELRQVPLDHGKILRVAGLDQHRGVRSGDDECGVVAVIDLALMALRQAVADPEHAGRDLARHFVGHAQRSSSRST